MLESNVKILFLIFTFRITAEIRVSNGLGGDSGQDLDDLLQMKAKESIWRKDLVVKACSNDKNGHGLGSRSAQMKIV
jgi:hypothetical protein